MGNAHIFPVRSRTPFGCDIGIHKVFQVIELNNGWVFIMFCLNAFADISCTYAHRKDVAVFTLIDYNGTLCTEINGDYTV